MNGVINTLDAKATRVVSRKASQVTAGLLEIVNPDGLWPSVENRNLVTALQLAAKNPLCKY